MKNMRVILTLIFSCLFLAACNTTNETDDSNETPLNNDVEEDSSVNDDETEEADYTEEQVTGDYVIYAEWLEGMDLLLYFTRTTDELTHEERFHQSLMESDPSQRDLFSNTTNFEVDGNVVNLYFNENDNLSMASTESSQFWDVLREIGFLYGVEEFNLYNQDGERGLTFAENIWEEQVEMEQVPTRGYYVMSPEHSEHGAHTYISGAVAEEEIYSEDSELLDFGQTVEVMATVENNEEAYYSGIYEGVEIEEATIDGDQAIVKYHISEDAEASQQEREDFEQVLQLAALDFQAEELRIVNETDQVISIYPLLTDIDSNEDTVVDNDIHSENNTAEEQEKNTELTREDAPGKVFDYLEEHEGYDPEDITMMVQEDLDEEGNFIVQAFVFSPEGEEVQMTNTIGWYLVDKETGEVEEREL